MLASERPTTPPKPPSFAARTPARERKGVRPVGLKRKGVSLGHLRASLCDPVDPSAGFSKQLHDLLDCTHR